MNPGQTKFYEFIKQRTQNEKINEIDLLLQESFSKQNDGTFTPDYLKEFTPKMLACIKPEYVNEVAGIVEKFGQSKTS